MSNNWRRNLWIIWIAQILSLSGFNFGLPFLPYFIQELGVTDTSRINLWTGIMASAPALSMAVMAPIWGNLADHIGKKIMLLRAMFFGAIILACLSFAHSVTFVFILRLLQGFLTGTITAAAALVSAGTPKDKLSYALGILSSSNFIGISIGPLFGGIAAEYLGYRPSFMIGAAILAAGFFLVLFTIKENKVSEDGRNINNEASGNENGRLVTFSIVGALFIILILRFSRILPIPFIPLYIQDFLGTVDGAASTTGFISFARGAVTALASVTIVRLGDRYNKLKMISILVAISAIITFPVFLMQSLFGFSAFFILATFFMGGIEPLLQSEIIGNVPAKKQGLMFGIQTTVGNLGWFAAPLAGSFISNHFSINAVFFAMFVFLSLAAVTIVFFTFFQRKKNIS